MRPERHSASHGEVRPAALAIGNLARAVAAGKLITVTATCGHPQDILEGVQRDWPWPCESCSERLAAEEERQRRERARQQRRANSGIPRHLQHATLAQLLQQGWDPQLIFTCNQWLQYGARVFLYGSNGVGKTTAAGAAAWEMAAKRRIEWIRAATFGRWVMAPFQSEEWFTANRLANGNGPLVIDDLGQEQRNPQVAAGLRDAIDNRIDSGVPLLVTSNYRPDELASDPLYGDWLGSRLAEFQQIVIQGPDHRLKETS